MTNTNSCRRARSQRFTLGAAGVVSLALVLGACSSPAGAADDVAAPAETGATGASFVKTEMTDGVTNFYVVENPNGGATLSFSADSGIELLTVEDGGYELAFKDMNDNGELDVWEDWRLPAEARATDLVENLTIEQISGLMLFSGHTNSDDLLTDVQRGWIDDNHMRFILNAGDSYVVPNVQWNNQMQAFAESLRSADNPLVPVSIASDPRSTAGAAIYDAEGEISGWPGNLGLAATFDTQYMLNFAHMASAEYRALGITTALSPQIDLASDPRWIRNEGTLGEDVSWTRELAAAYVDGFQDSYGTGEWGTESVGTMIKHFGGDGPNEGGRVAHLYAGQFDVFPGGAYNDHFEIYRDSMHSAGVMTGYPIAIDRDGNPLWSTETRDREGNIIEVPGGISTAFNVDIMDQLRGDLGFDGVVVTDWGVMSNPGGFMNTGWGTHGEEFIADWAVGVANEDLTEDIIAEQRMAMAQRHFVLLVNGVDMLGGHNQMQSVIGGDWTVNRTEEQGGPITAENIDGAFQMWERAYELGNLPIDARTRWEESGVRILTNFMFNTGLYENPFLDLENSQAVVGAAEKQAAGFEAQLASVIMLANQDGTVSQASMADWADKTVYVPGSVDLGWAAFGPAVTTYGPMIDTELLEYFFGTVITDEIVTDEDGNVVEFIAPSDEELANVDLVLVGMDTPNNGSQFSSTGFDRDLQEWQPISLQWGEYTADGEYVRQESITSLAGVTGNRSYFGNTARISNAAHLDSFNRAVAIAEGLEVPVITLVRGVGSSTFVPGEIYGDSDAILLGFGISDQALIEVALGLREPSGRLPITMPADMDAVERQYEDVADTAAFVDNAGNAWGFGFGLNWTGVIN